MKALHRHQKFLQVRLRDWDRAKLLVAGLSEGWYRSKHLFPDGSAVRLTVARYYTPTGRSIHRNLIEWLHVRRKVYDQYKHGEMVKC